MTNDLINLLPTTLDALSQEFCKVPHLSEKMLIDLVNGHEVAEDLLRARKSQGTFGRIIGALDGSNRRREIIIQEQTQRSLESLTSWALDLTDAVRFTEENVIIVAKKLEQTRGELMSVAQAVFANREGIVQIENCLAALDYRLSLKLQEAEERLLKVEDKQEILELTEAWMSGRYYAGYPLPLQVTFVVDDLMRGERGRRIMKNSNAKGFLLDRIINITKEKQPEMVGSTLSLTDNWLPSAALNAGIKRELATYGVASGPQGYLHNSLSAYVSSQKIPEWYFERQENGDLFELMDIVDFTKSLMHEAIAA